MKKISLGILSTLGFLTLVGASTLIKPSQIKSGGVIGSFSLTSINGVVAWTAITTPNFSDAETPSGTINGTNTTFTLAHADAATGNSLILTLNGIVLQGNGNDYTLSGNTITFGPSTIPQNGDTLQAWYRY